jgi:hypothetical protein
MARRCADTPLGYLGGVRGNEAVTGRVGRWLLLACTVIGLAAMHTLGHAGSHSGVHRAAGHGERPAAVSAAQAEQLAGQSTTGHDPGAPVMVAAAAVALINVVTDGCAGHGCPHVQPAPEPGRHDLPAWSVCLAVLAGLGVAVLLAWLLISGRAPAGDAVRRVAGRVGESRTPPWPGFGLQLVSVSVMRI